ncbi:MAG: hypothetical protein KDB14_19570 [Planctomycetales bacterium]|nr:hypothetical protein [Planctomycetales bacterium]
MRRFAATFVAVIAVFSGLAMSSAEEGAKVDVIKLSEGKITLPAPASWERKQPRTRIVEHEFAAKGPEGTSPARITLMGAGGGVEANIDRWVGQFRQKDGSSSRDKTKVERAKVGDTEVHVVDISGVYQDSPGGPFAGGRVIPREDYRMLAAIIVTPKSGHYFIKMIGEADTVEANAKAFREMLTKLNVK